ncbi:hypothetical protein AB0H71_28980 [Nocardia sp. NPDC050697]|uniref:hypothetical protein n=1 Tax=Nocardia sp. NPDC050697 TaxID=3155158 RepID=UPI0033E17878
MSKDYDPTKDSYEIARRAKVIVRAFNPEAPTVSLQTVIRVSVSVGDGSPDAPQGRKDFYYTEDGELIGERS